MKKLSLLLLSIGISLSLLGQESIENRVANMYKTINEGNIETYIKEYMYNEVFDIIPKDTLIRVVKSVYNADEYDIQMKVKEMNGISNTIDQNGVKYALVKTKTEMTFKMKRDYFVQDSINIQRRNDSLRTAMATDTAYATVLAKHNTEDYQYEDGELSIWDFPYYELPDSTEAVSTVDELMNEQLSMIYLGFMMVLDKKALKQMNLKMDTENKTFTIDNWMEKGLIAILDPNYKEWQFIAYNTENPMIMNYLVPIEVRKKLKIK